MAKIGILFPPQESGGVFQLALSIFESISSYLCLQCLKINIKEKNFLEKIISPFYQNKEFDLAIFPTPFSFNFPRRVPFIVFIPDLMHKHYPSFPEYGLKQRFTRDMVYKYYAKHSILNLVDSQQGVEDLYKFFSISKEKIRIIPFIPASYVFKYKDMGKEIVETLSKKYNLPEKFLFYPAQLWYHKNHLRLIKALYLIKENYGIEIPLVLTGSVSGGYQKNYQKIRELAKNLKIENQIIHLGYVSEKEIVAFYKKSTALIFPSLIGPTSIPPLEAMVLGTPILCSNLFEMPKQVGNAGIFFNPFSVEDIAEKIYKIWTDENLRQELIRKGYERTKELTLENYAKKWERVIKEALKIYEEKRY